MNHPADPSRRPDDIPDPDPIGDHLRDQSPRRRASLSPRSRGTLPSLGNLAAIASALTVVVGASYMGVNGDLLPVSIFSSGAAPQTPDNNPVNLAISEEPTKIDTPPPLYPQGRQWELASDASSDASEEGEFTVARRIVRTITDPAVRALADRAVQTAIANTVIENIYTGSGELTPSLGDITDPDLKSQAIMGVNLSRADQAAAEAVVGNYGGARALCSQINSPSIAGEVTLTIRQEQAGNTNAAYATSLSIATAAGNISNSLSSPAATLNLQLAQHTAAYDHFWDGLPSQ